MFQSGSRRFDITETRPLTTGSVYGPVTTAVSIKASFGDAIRLTVVGYKSEDEEPKLQEMFKDGTMDDLAKSLTGLKAIQTFFDDESCTLVVAARYDTMQNLDAALPTNKSVLGSYASSFSGAPSIYSGNTVWSFQGPAKELYEEPNFVAGRIHQPATTRGAIDVATRATIVPIKPNSEVAIVEVLRSDEVTANFKGPAYKNLIDLYIFFSGNNVVAISRWTSLDACKAADAKLKETLGLISSYIAGEPQKYRGSTEWAFPALKPIESGCVCQ